jgi:hypothetical protein
VASKSDIFVQEFVLGFGFLGGLFTWVGVDPEEAVIRTLLNGLFPNNEGTVNMVIVLLILGSTVLGIYGTWQMAGKWGLFVVGMAWVSGLVIAVSSLTLLGAIFLITALILGSIMCDNYQKSR